MNYQKTKIYYDGSHYIGIPQGAYPSGKGCKRRAVKQAQQPTTVEQSLNAFETAYKESQSLPKRERKAHRRRYFQHYLSTPRSTTIVGRRENRRY